MTTITHDLGHGMGNDWENKDWAHLTVSELHNLQPYYPCLQGSVQILWCSPRPFSSAAVIEVTQDAASTDKIGSRSYFIKRSHRSFRNAQDIFQSMLFCNIYASKNIPVATLIASNCGLTALEMGDWTYEVYEKAAGFDLYVDQQSWTPFFYTEHAAKSG